MNWFKKDGSSSNHNNQEKNQWNSFLSENYFQLSPKTRQQLESIETDFFSSNLYSPPLLLFGAAVSVTSFAIGFRLGRVRPVWRQIKSLQDLSSSDIGAKNAQWMRGKVVSVSDGDTFRFVHLPTWFHSTSGNKQNDDNKMAIRLCTIDTPETAKFGKPGQPYGEEAKEYLKSLCLDNIVRIKLLQIDQYGRGVAEVKKGRIWKTYLDEAMLLAGLAEVYHGSGAVYGRLGKDKYVAIAEKAKKNKKGMWKDANRESASEYKRRIKAEETA